MLDHPVMGLGLLFFDFNEWKKLYADNCANHSMVGYSNIPIGLLYIHLGVFCELLYIPFMVVMWRHEFMQHSCYKFMFLLGVIDMITLPFNAIITGFQGMLGIHYCHYPAFFFVVGSISIAGWFGATMTCCIIAIDRFLSFVYPVFGTMVFSGKMMRLWFSIPLTYWVFIMITNVPGIYNINHHAMFYDPWYGEEGMAGKQVYLGAQMLHYNSLFTVPILGGCYGVLCVVITVKTLVFKTSNISKLQRVMLYQSMCICVEIFITATVYVSSAMGLINVPVFLEPAEHAIWIAVHADTPIVYMLFNASLRKAVKDWCKQKIKNQRSTLPYLTSQIAPTQ